MPAQCINGYKDAIYSLDIAGGSNSIQRLTRDNKLFTTNYSLTGSQSRAFHMAGSSQSTDIYVAGNQDLYRSSDAGVTWQRLVRPLEYVCCIGSIETSGNGLIATYSDRLYRSSDYGSHWQAVGEPALGFFMSPIITHGATTYFGLSNSFGTVTDVISSTTPPMHGLGLGKMPTQLVIANRHLIAATTDGLWIDTSALPSLAMIKRPVIVIPGIMGSWPKQFGLVGELALDPLTHTYDSLVQQLEAVGFRDSLGTLKLFPYQWRQSNRISAGQLAAKIEEVRRQCRCEQVDIVAHSMGGLVARAYIQGNDYHHDVARLIEVATPNRGSVKAYYLYENGEFYDQSPLLSGTRLQNGILRSVFQLEATAHGYPLFADYIRQRVPSVQDLLPSYSYIIGRVYPLGYPQNSFLDELNEPVAVARLKDRVGLYVLGSDRLLTLSSLIVEPPTGQRSWPDGRPRVTSESDGDGTVPIESLRGLNQVDGLQNASHGGLVTTTASEVIAYLLGDSPDQAYLDQNKPSLPVEAPTVAAPIAAVREAVIMSVVTTAGLSVRDQSGGISTPTQQTLPNAYRFTDGELDIIVLNDPRPTQQLLNLSVSHTNPVTVTISTIDETGERHEKYVMLNGHDEPQSTTTVRLDGGPSNAARTYQALPKGVDTGLVLAAVSSLPTATQSSLAIATPHAQRTQSPYKPTQMNLWIIMGIAVAIIGCLIGGWYLVFKR